MRCQARNIYYKMDNATQRRKRIYIQWARYAAIVIVAVAAACFFVGQCHTVKSTGTWITEAVSHTDSSKLVVLNDGSRVWLNSNSIISWSRELINGKRMVTLLGEAYFDVTYDAAHPFIVQTPGMNIKVLGTAFNVQAYPDESQTEAVLVRGKIAIDDSLGNELAVISPNQIARFEKNNRRLAIENVNPDIYTGWRYGQITLTAASLATICSKLSELYQVRFSVAASLKDSTRYNFMFSKKKTITEVMNMMCFIAPIRYQIQPTGILITPH